MKQILFIPILFLALVSCKNNSQPRNADENMVKNISDSIQKSETEEKEIVIHPIEHASMVLNWDGTLIYVDPVGNGEAYLKYGQPDLILVTDIHGDHFDITTLISAVTEKTHIIAPKAVFDKLPEDLQKKTEILNNGDKATDFEITVEAIPMYNLRKEALQYHPKGRGNGYILEKNNKRLYISGDTEDIPEMRNLKNIDIAFVCMNLPYTMTVEKAAEAVLAFKPITVYPYHYRGTDGLSDVEKFKSLVESKDPNINVIQLDWYPKK